MSIMGSVRSPTSIFMSPPSACFQINRGRWKQAACNIIINMISVMTCNDLIMVMIIIVLPDQAKRWNTMMIFDQQMIR